MSLAKKLRPYFLKVVSRFELAEGFKIPRGWGISYWDLRCDKYIIHPIPLNWIVSGIRAAVLWLKVPYWERKYRAAEQKKCNEAWNDGWNAGYKDYKEIWKRKEE